MTQLTRAQQNQARCEQAGAFLNAGASAQANLLFDLVLADDPLNISALEGLVRIATASGQLDKTQRLLERLLVAAPGHIDARLTLGDILMQTGQLTKARVQAERVIALQPQHPAGYYLLGLCLWNLGDVDGAFASFDQARFDLVPALLGQIQYLSHLRLAEADWRGYAAQTAFFNKQLQAGQAWQPTYFMLTSSSAADIALAARTYARMLHPPQPPVWLGERWRHERIKIAFVTCEIWDHPVAHLMAGYLEHFDHTAFEVFGVSYGPLTDDPVRQRLIATFDTFLEAGALDDLGIARLLRHEIDIAISLGGYGHNSRPQIFAHRPAPVQVNFQGYPGTMGAPYIDYLIADRTVIPEAETDLYSEKIVWMPDTYQPTDNRAPIGATPTRAQEGLPENAFVFMAYNVAYKISPAIFEVWMRILQRVKGSVLWLPAGEGESAANFRRGAATRGVDPSRLIFAARKPARPDHIARHKLADLFLDTLPFNAHSTASDALWAGLPVISCRGTTFPGRVCSGLLTAAGLPELVVENIQDYEDLAVALAGDPQRLADLRQRIARDVPASPLFDTARYTRNLETALRRMHEIHQTGEAPRSFAVSDAN